MDENKMDKLDALDAICDSAHDVRGVAVALDALGMRADDDALLMLGGKLHDVADALERAKEALEG